MGVKFAVVGHPNKGKSTIVSNLIMDDSIAISEIPGTTTKAKEYSLMVDGKVVYTLIDTPGFQRPRQVLEFLESKNVPAHKRKEVLKEFIELNKNNPKFSDDIELLKPIVEGAGVIYVVDASKPYSLEYENDMKILAYSGAESMAILNFIDDSDYSKEWSEVLKHYFKIIKPFNPMVADIKAYIDLLEAIGHLNYEWSESIKISIDAFKKLYENRIKENAIIIANLIFKVLEYKKKTKYSPKDEAKRALQKEFKNDIKGFEKKSFEKIKNIWEHKNIKPLQDEVNIREIELFSKEAEEFFGLSRKDFILYATGTGAAIGAGVDLAFLGHTAFLGAGVGALLGGVGAYFSFDKALEVKVMGLSLGRKYLEIGPIEDINFLFILLNRALIYTKEIATLSYAKRGELKLNLKKSEVLTGGMKKKLFKLNKALIDNKESDKIKKEYQGLLEKVIKEIIESN